jgi:hypothetical protein
MAAAFAAVCTAEARDFTVGARNRVTRGRSIPKSRETRESSRAARRE